MFRKGVVLRINVVGGGPAGLYFAILMKKADAAHEITVFERNPAGATYGFGVVFSNETLGNFLGFDQPTLDDITANFAYWDEIEVRYRDRAIRCGGHGFCGIARMTLLNILQRRAEALGVKLEFDTDITDLERLRDADVLVGADGVNSLVRSAYQQHFDPRIDLRRTKFIWLGSPRTFDAFTFVFRPNHHGWFYLHAYRYADDGTTWLVETHEDTWRRAGLDTADEATTVAYLEEFYAPELQGAPLHANRAEWRSFPMISNRHWHHDNVVLLGDAAHTAQFSIGSGTKIAMEGAAALAAALSGQDTVPTALAAYQQERENEIGALQSSALVSLKWYENARRYNDMAPEQYVFNFLTRTKGVTYDNLAMRDPGYIAEVTKWFAAKAKAGVGAETGLEVPTDEPPPPMFTPFRLRGATLANRVVVSPMCQYSARDGTPGDWHFVHLGGLAVGGAGLVYSEMTDVSPEGRITPGCAGMYSPEHVTAWRRIVDFVHANSGAVFCMQLAHAGRKGATELPWDGARDDEPLAHGGWPLISASALPYRAYSRVPKAMVRSDMDKVRNDFVAATKMAEAAGFDMVELHMAHGYLLSSFISPLSNHRDDAYGGTLANRMRFPLEVFDAMRAAWPEAKPMAVRISATDWVEDGGLTDDDAVAIARLLGDHGCDIIDVSAGQTTPEAEPVYGRMFQTPFSDLIRHQTGMATIAVGNITTADQINTIIAAGRADLCALARPHLTDPHFTLAAAAQYQHMTQLWPDQYGAAKAQSALLAERRRVQEREVRLQANLAHYRPPDSRDG